MERIPPFTSQQLTAICRVLGDTNSGFTGTEIGQFAGRLWDFGHRSNSHQMEAVIQCVRGVAERQTAW